MTLILDAAPLVALADAEEPQLEALLRIREEESPLVLPLHRLRPGSTTC